MSSVDALFIAATIFYRFKNPSTGLFGPKKKIHTEKLEISTPSDLKEKISKARDTYGQAFVSHRVAKPCEFTVTFSQVNKEIFAMMMSGITEEVNEAVQTITDHAVTVVLDEWISIGYANLNPVGLLVKNAAGVVTYVNDVDYEINPRLGLIKAKSNGAIAAGVIEITGATLAVTGTKIIGARQHKHTLDFEVDGVNQINGKNVVLRAGQATVSAESAHDFLSGELDSISLKGRLEIPEGGNSPFEMTLFD